MSTNQKVALIAWDVFMAMTSVGLATYNLGPKVPIIKPMAMTCEIRE